jgi:hypothetical protein
LPDRAQRGSQGTLDEAEDDFEEDGDEFDDVDKQSRSVPAIPLFYDNENSCYIRGDTSAEPLLRVGWMLFDIGYIEGLFRSRLESG